MAGRGEGIRAWLGSAWIGLAWQGQARPVRAWRGEDIEAGQGEAWLCEARQGNQGRGQVGPGAARRCKARLGKLPVFVRLRLAEVERQIPW